MRVHDYPAVETPDFLLAALEQANDAVVIVDGDLRISHFNAAAELIWEIPRASSRPRCQPSRARGPATASESRHRIPRRRPAYAERTASEITIGARMAAASAPRCRLRASRPAAKAAPSHSFGTSPPRSERRERIALLSLVADRTNRAVVVTDPNLKIVYTNAAFTGMFGYSHRGSEGPARRTSCCWAAYTDRRTLARLRRRIDDEDGGEEEILLYDKNGDEIWISADRQGVPRRAAGDQVHVRAC